jgi:hypothetical protein
MNSAIVADIAITALLALAGATQVYIWKEILSLRRSRHVHANVLQRHIGRFARIGEVLHIEWKDLEDDLTA